MIRRTIACTAAAAALLALGAAYAPRARSQINAMPSPIPIGVSASGSTSTAWFNDPSSRQVIACQTEQSPGGRLTGVHCVAGKLP